MMARWFLLSFILMVALGWLPPVQAQMGGRQDALNILNSLSPDLHAKIQRLAHLMDQSIKAGQLTDAEVQQGMMSGHLSEKLQRVNPEAGQLLDEIRDAMKNGQGPGESALMPLLGGLGITP